MAVSERALYLYKQLLLVADCAMRDMPEHASNSYKAVHQTLGKR